MAVSLHDISIPTFKRYLHNVDAFMTNIAWERVADRHRRAAEGLRPARPADADVPEMTVGQARRVIEDGEILVLDVCWDEDLAKSPDMLPTAVHHDARRIAEWADTVPKNREVLAYCVYGFQVSRDAVTELRRRGVSAHTLAGGSQSITGGPVASQEAIKELGTNGGGFYNANSSHPFENPTAWSNFFEIYLLLLVSFCLPRTFGKMVGDKRQGYAIVAVMASSSWLG